MNLPLVKVAAAHAAPVRMNVAAIVGKAISFIDEAARPGEAIPAIRAEARPTRCAGSRHGILPCRWAVQAPHRTT